jgi:hypothetical protein
MPEFLITYCAEEDNSGSGGGGNGNGGGGTKLELTLRVSEKKFEKKFRVFEKETFERLIIFAALYFKMPNLRSQIDCGRYGSARRPTADRF